MITKNENIVSEVALKELQAKLEKRGFKTVILNSEREVKDFINRSIPDEQIVGLGDSITTCTLNIRHILAAKGSTIFFSWDGSEQYNRSLDTFDEMARPDFYLSRINVITMEGEILMKDYNRKAAIDNEFPKQVFAFAGMNSLCETLEERESLSKYTVIRDKPSRTEFTVALLPYLNF